MIQLTKELIKEYIDSYSLNVNYSIQFTIRVIGTGNLQQGNNEPALFIGNLIYRGQNWPTDAWGQTIADGKVETFGIWDQEIMSIDQIQFIGYQITFATPKQKQDLREKIIRFLPYSDVITDY